MEVWINDKKARIGLKYQRNYNSEYDYIFMINEDQENGWADGKKELG